MTATTMPDLCLTLHLDPELCWTTCEMLVADEALIQSLGRARLEALARLVRELSLNAYRYGDPGSSGRLSGDLGQRSFEARFCSEPFDGVAQAQKSRNCGCPAEREPRSLRDGRVDRVVDTWEQGASGVPGGPQAAASQPERGFGSHRAGYQQPGRGNGPGCSTRPNGRAAGCSGWGQLSRAPAFQASWRRSSMSTREAYGSTSLASTEDDSFHWTSRG